VHLLIAERTKYEEWLRELEAKREQTPAKVFARVHADYTSRLNTVAEQLKQHTRSMQEHAGNLMAKLRELEASAKKLEDEIAESQIRRQVGELSPNEADSIAKKAQRELARLEDDQERIAADLNRIRHMLGGRPASDEDDEDRPRTSRDFDELEFLQSVVGTSTPAATPVPKPTPSGNSAPPAVRPQTPAQGAQPQRAIVPPTTQVIVPPTQPPPPPQQLVPKQPTPPEGPLTIRSSGATEQPKTLKCAECGSMNYPSEWYCERCGAELAAI
jgi:hypothetical protein